MRRYWLLGLLLLVLQTGRAEGLKMHDVFKQMPDTLLATLSENNRLDMLDFMASNMKADDLMLLQTHNPRAYISLRP